MREGVVAVQCGAFHLSTGGQEVLQHDAARTRRDDDGDRARDARGRRRVFSDGSTHKGNDIQRFFRYGVLVNPALEIYKPWLDRAFVEAFGGRKEMSEYLASIGKPYTMADGEGLLDRLERARRDPRGQGPRAPRQGHAHRRADHGRRALEPDVRIEPEAVTVELLERRPGRGGRQASGFAVRDLPAAQRNRAVATVSA